MSLLSDAILSRPFRKKRRISREEAIAAANNKAARELNDTFGSVLHVRPKWLREQLAKFGWDKYMEWAKSLPPVTYPVGYAYPKDKKAPPMARLTHSDRFGKLWLVYVGRDPLNWVGGRPMRVLEVENSTPDKNGKRTVYYIPVHTHLRPMRADGTFGQRQALTARNAVASTFGLYGHQYHIGAES